MTTNLADATSRNLAITAISGYQKFISPHKGFACAHRVLYGTESCSQYFKRTIAEDGILTAIANAKGRFQECREASVILKQRRQKYYMMRDNQNNQDNQEMPQDDSLDNQDNQDNQGEQGQRIGGSQWDRKSNLRGQSSNTQSDQNNRQNNGNNNCDRYNDCLDCANCADVAIDLANVGNCRGDRCDNPLEGAECPELNCPDLSCPDLNCGDLNCGDADCLSGLECGSCG